MSPLVNADGSKTIATCTTTAAAPCALQRGREVWIGSLEIVRLMVLRPVPARIAEGRLRSQILDSFSCLRFVSNVGVVHE